MHIYLAGLNHRTAPIEIRERIAFSESELPNALERLREQRGISEAVILSTCNRTEIYAVCTSQNGHAILLDFLADANGVPLCQFSHLAYLYQDDDAAAHLMDVASGLDSLVLGEPQILGQVRDTFTTAMKARATGTILNSLFRAAIATGKRARTETEIGKGGFSIGHAAVDLAKSIFGELADSKVLILGAGKMSELTAKHLLASGIGVVFVANRTFDRATALASRLGGRAIQYDEFPEMLAAADIVISSTAAPVHILTRASIMPALKKRRGRPLFLIDIAMPRDISPDIAEIDNVFLYDIDDLESVVEDMARGRESERAKVEEIVKEETIEFMKWLRSLEAVPIVTRLKQKHERIRQLEIDRLRNQLPDLPDEAWARIEAAMRSLVNRVGKEPIERLKAAASSGGQEPPESLLDAARELFGLERLAEEEPLTSSTTHDVPEQSTHSEIRETEDITSVVNRKPITAPVESRR